MDPLFPEIPDDLASLSDDELSALLEEHQIALDKIEAEEDEYVGGLSADEVLAGLELGVEQIKTIKAEQGAREEAAAAYEARKAELAAEARGVTDTEDDDDDEALASDDETLSEDTHDDEAEAVEEPDTEAAPLQASVSSATSASSSVVQATGAQVRVYRRPPMPTADRLSLEERPRAQVVTKAGVDGVTGGQVLDRLGLARAMVECAQRRGKPHKFSGGTAEKILIAAAEFPFPPERTLRSQDLDGNSDKIRSIGSPWMGPQGRQALVASGGLCAPLEPIYDLPNLATTARPVRDALPSFRAERGGVQVPTPTTIGDITTAITVIEEEDDALGGTYATKSCQALDCPAWTNVAVGVISHCREYGNLNAMAWPEGIAHENDLTMAAHSRTADGRLLDRLTALSLNLTYTVGYGAVSILIGGLIKARASTISVLRMDPGVRFRALLPFWAADVYAWDLVNSQFGRFDTPQSGVAAALARYNIDVSWYLDTATGASQVFADEVDSSTVDDFDNSVVAYVFPEGTFLHLDSGTLELGIVRDSTLNSTNDYQVFGETFENVARIGPQQAAKEITFTVCPDGRVAAPEQTEITCS